jgi:ADP-heptose:LPS heptosyltransferase
MRAPSISVAGRLGVAELAAAIGRARVFIGNNSGPAHLAAAVGTPTVVLYALTNPQHTPWRVPSRVLSHDVPCRNCYSSICPMGHHACLRRVPPDDVVDAVRSLASETAPSPPVPARA